MTFWLKPNPRDWFIGIDRLPCNHTVLGLLFLHIQWPNEDCIGSTEFEEKKYKEEYLRKWRKRNK